MEEKPINPQLDLAMRVQRKQDFYAAMGAMAAKPEFRSSLNLKSWEPWKDLSGWIDAYSAKSPAVSERSGQKFSTVWTCLNVLRETRGSLPCSVLRSGPNGRETIYDNPVHYLVHDRPNPMMTAFTFWALMELYKKAWGNAYAEIIRNGMMEPVAIWPRAPWEVEVRSRGDELVYVYKGSREIANSNMLHFKNYTDNGIIGVSTIRQNAISIGLGLKLKQYNSSIVDERPYGYLTAPSRPKDRATKDRMRSTWTNPDGDNEATGTDPNLGKTGKIGSIPLLYGGLEFKSFTMPADDVAYIESAKLTDREIYGIFRMLPTFAQDWEKAPYNSSEQQDIHFVKYTLAGIREDEQECNEKLFPESNKRKADGLYIKFNLSGLLRGDISARMMMYRTLINLSVMTPAQAAELEDLPIEGIMKRYYVQGAMVPVDKLDEFIGNKGASQTVKQQEEDEAKRAAIIEELRDLIKPRLNGHYKDIADILEP